MPHLDRDGVNIYYEDHGSGPVVLLSHGYSATSKMWAAQASALRDRFRVITWDMRGHGDTDSPADPSAYSEAHTVRDMAALLDACGVQSAVIAGLSLGGYMSLAFHLNHPGRVSALMLFDTGPGYKNPQARRQWNDRAEQWATALETDGLEALAVMGGDEMRANLHRSAEGLARAARGMLAQFNARVIESLPGIRVPTLILVGENDRPFHAPTDYMAKKIPQAIKVIIPDAGHAANLHQPEAFNDAIHSFLESLPSEAGGGGGA